MRKDRFAFFWFWGLSCNFCLARIGFVPWPCFFKPRLRAVVLFHRTVFFHQIIRTRLCLRAFRQCAFQYCIYNMHNLASFYATWVFQSHCIVHRFGNSTLNCVLYLSFFLRVYLCLLYRLLYPDSGAGCGICPGLYWALWCFSSSGSCTVCLVMGVVVFWCRFGLG